MGQAEQCATEINRKPSAGGKLARPHQLHPGTRANGKSTFICDCHRPIWRSAASRLEFGRAGTMCLATTFFVGSPAVGRTFTNSTARLPTPGRCMTIPARLRGSLNKAHEKKQTAPLALRRRCWTRVAPLRSCGAQNRPRPRHPHLPLAQRQGCGRETVNTLEDRRRAGAGAESRARQRPHRLPQTTPEGGDPRQRCNRWTRRSALLVCRRI